MSKIGTLLTFTLLLFLSGCDSKDASGDKADSNEDDAPVLAPFSVAAPLVEYDETTADQIVDNGRLTLKLITDWKEKNEKRGNLFVFLKGGKSYPTLIISKPEDAPETPTLDDTTKSAFLAEVTKAVTEKYKSFVLEKPKLIEIKGYPWVFYRVSMKSNTQKLEVPFLTTVANGRKYTIQMWALEKQANNDWPALLTMASGMTFGEQKSAEPPAPDKQPTATEPEKAAPAATEPLPEMK